MEQSAAGRLRNGCIGYTFLTAWSFFSAINDQPASELWNCFKADTFPKLCREILYREAKEILTNMEVDGK